MSLRRKIYEVIEVADKDDRDSLIYDRFMLVCIAASIVPLCFKETNSLFVWLDRATVTVFIVDYLLRWWTADLKYEKSGKWAFLRYPFSFFGILAAILAVFGIGFMIPVLGEYFRTGLVPRFPTLIVCCFVLVAALLLFISGIILSSQLAKDARDFEFQLQTVQHWRNSAEKEN